MSISRYSFFLIIALPALACDGTEVGAKGPSVATNRRVKLDFTWETQNLEVIKTALRAVPKRDVSLCTDLETSDLLYGYLPHRNHNESMLSTSTFIIFAVEYVLKKVHALWIDHNGDDRLACDERLAVVPHPSRPGRALRTVEVDWPERDIDDRRQRYRVTVPLMLEMEGDFTVDIVDVPTSLWRTRKRESALLLFDGNYDGVFERRFGDGLMVDVNMDMHLVADPFGGEFFSFELPVVLPWGTFIVEEIDPRGRFIILREEASAKWGELEVGEIVPPLMCRTFDGKLAEIRFEDHENYTIIYFWLSHCGSCSSDLEAIAPVVAGVGASRLLTLGVSLDEERSDALVFARGQLGDWIHCFEGEMSWDNRIARQFGVRGPSEFVIIDSDSRFVRRGRGQDEIIEALEDLFDGNAAVAVQ